MRETSWCLFVTLSFNQADVVETFNSTVRYLDDLLNIDNPYLEKNGKSDIPHLTSVKKCKFLQY